MSSLSSVSNTLALAKEGDEDACRQLFDRFYPWLRDQARRRLRQQHLVWFEPEDVLAKAYEAFLRCVRKTEARRREDLEAVLAQIVWNCARNLGREERAAKRPDNKVVGSGDTFQVPDRNREDYALLPAQFIDLLPPGDAGEDDGWGLFTRKFVQHLDALAHTAPDANLPEIALLAFFGYGQKEIAERLGCSLRYVQRKVPLIKEILTRETDDA